MVRRLKAFGSAAVRFTAVPWGAFIAAFLFYVGVTLVVFSVEDLPDMLVIAAYLAPVAAYLLVLAARATRVVAALTWPAAHPAPVPLVR